MRIIATAKRRRAQLCAAFGIAEAVMAILVIATMTVTLYAAFSSGFAYMELSREDLRATQILMQKVEAIRLCRWSYLSNAPISFVDSYDPLANRSQAGVLYRSVVTTNVATPIPNTATYKTNMCKLTVTVFWTNWTGDKPVVRTRQAETLVARYGIQNYIGGSAP